MVIKLSDMIANLFIELDDNNLPMIIDLRQLYRIAGIISKDGKYKVDLSGASIFELRFNSDRYFNYIKDTKTIVPSTSIKVEDLKARYRNNISSDLYNLYKDSQIKTVLGIKFYKPKVFEKQRLDYFAMTK